ncbi:TPA: hypothetical protein N0F65_008527 [Lagenidium giganteum]|uniref:WW domain-containing protein n=1 Tax=Lagenidium giganteum TaxID=4803 RepID=A0AAV2Z676_9STRA|nr:TPA: hypothetical protein N0F65_008527 [Lagenidium giganteum]
MDGGQADSIVLEEEIDPNYEPTEKEVLEYATWLGMDLEAEKDLLWIAREGLKAPLPENWKPCKTTDTEEIYYFNFLTGNSTWDHPCDEFYRNLYEEHKKKRLQTHKMQDGDEKKKKEKEDVAELLGKKKKKKAPPSRAEPLGPPTPMGKANPLEKKPLPGLSSKLGTLSASGLKPVSSLGRLKSSTDEETKHVDEDDDNDKEAAFKSPKALSKPPLGNLLTKKSLGSTSTLSKAESKTDLSGLENDFESKKQKLLQEHERKLAVIEQNQADEIESLRKRSQKQLEDLQDEEDTKVRQKKKELDRKLHDLENQYDQDENTLLRTRKDKLKRLENDTETTLSEKKQEIEAEQKKELERLRSKHESTMKDLKEQFEQEEAKTEAKLKEIGMKTDAISATVELKAEVDELSTQLRTITTPFASTAVPTICGDCETLREAQSKLEHEKKDLLARLAHHEQNIAELQARSDVLLAEKDAVLQEAHATASASATSCDEFENLRQIQSKMEDEKKELVARVTQHERSYAELQSQNEILKAEKEAALQQVQAASSPSPTPTPSVCGVCETLRQLQLKLEDEKKALTVRVDQYERDNAELESELRRKTAEDEDNIARANKLSKDLKNLETKHSEEIANLRDIESALRVELKSAQNAAYVAQQKANELEMERARLSSECTRLSTVVEQNQSTTSSLAREESRAGTFEARWREAQSELDTLKGLVSDLQDQVQSAGKMNAQLKEQLSKESNEKKNLREQLDLMTDNISQIESEKQDATRKCEELRSQLRCEVEAKEELQSKVNAVKSELGTVETDKQKLIHDISRLESEKRQLTSDNAMLGRRMEEMAHKKRLEDLKDANEMEAVIDKQKWEIEQLQGNHRVALADKANLEDELARCNIELENLRSKLRVMEGERDAEAARSKKKDMERDTLLQRLKSSEDDGQALQLKVRTLIAEIGEMKAQLNRLKFKDDGASTKIDQMNEELNQQQQRLDDSQAEIDKLQKHIKQKSTQLDEKSVAFDELRTEHELLKHQLEELKTTAQRSTGFETQSLQSKMKRLEQELEHAMRDLKQLQNERENQDTKIRQLTQENMSLEAKLRQSKQENTEHTARAKFSEEDLVRTADAVKKLEAQLLEKDAKLKREIDEKDLLTRQLTVATSAREDLESAMASIRRKLETAEAKLKESESSSSKDDFHTKLKFQQLEAERDSAIGSKDRAEYQLKSTEKELSTAKEEMAAAKNENDSLRARIKSLLNEKEEIQSSLLSANLASATASARIKVPSALETSQEAMLVRLQLADVNKNELENHLADVASQLDMANRRSAALESRCRDQAIDIESLHVEISSLRAASQKMHLSALETLSLAERLEYEHKKRALKSDYQAQLRDFQEREEHAVIRHKARLRAKYEKQLDDLVAELEKKNQQRLYQEEQLGMQMLAQIRQERDVKVKELKRQIQNEIDEVERELLARKDQQLDFISNAIQKGEEELGQRLRETKQAIREEQLAETSLRDNGMPPFTLQTANDRKSFERSPSPGELRSDGDEDSDLRRQPRTRFRDSPIRQQRSALKEGYTKSPGKGKSAGLRKKRVSSSYLKWKQRIKDENALLAKARHLLASQKQELKKQAEKLKREKHEWKRDSQRVRNADHNPVLQEMKRMIDRHTTTWNQSVKQLREAEMWMKRRERKIDRMQAAVQNLRSKDERRRLRSNNDNSSDDSSSDDEMQLDDDNQSEMSSVLEELEKLDEELVADISDISEEAGGELLRVAPAGAATLDRGIGSNNIGVDTPHPVAPMYVPAHELMMPAYPQFRYPMDTGYARIDPFYSMANDIVPFSTSSRLYRSHRIPQTSQSVRTAPSSTRSSALHPASYRTDVFQRQISRWAKDREKLQAAATKQATWLSGLYQEVKDYNERYKTKDEGRILAATDVGADDDAE